MKSLIERGYGVINGDVLPPTDLKVAPEIAVDADAILDRLRRPDYWDQFADRNNFAPSPGEDTVDYALQLSQYLFSSTGSFRLAIVNARTARQTGNLEQARDTIASLSGSRNLILVLTNRAEAQEHGPGGELYDKLSETSATVVNLYPSADEIVHQITPSGVETEPRLRDWEAAGFSNRLVG